MTTYRRFLPLLLVLPLLATARPAAAQQEDAAVEAAQAWLALVDADAYDESYEAASGLLKQAVTAEQWRETIGGLQAQLATLNTAPADTAATTAAADTAAADAVPDRELIEARHTTELPNAPAGEYVVAQYRRIVGEQPIVEVVVLTLEEDVWRVAGYFARPEQP